MGIAVVLGNKKSVLAPRHLTALRAHGRWRSVFEDDVEGVNDAGNVAETYKSALSAIL